MIVISPGEDRIQPSFMDFNLSLQTVDIVIEESSELGETTTRDLIYSNYSSGITRKDGRVSIGLPLEYTALYTSQDESLSLVDSSGYITTLSNGDVGIVVQLGNTKRKITHQGRFVGPTLTSVFDRYAEGTLGEEIANQIDSLVATGKTSMNLIADGQWNTSCWASDLDWSGVALSNSSGGNRRGATLISPQHVYMATHFPVGVGQTITYLTQAGEQTTRTLTARQDLGNDVMIGVLDSPITNIAYYKVLPANWAEYISLAQQPQIICTDQQRKAILRNWLNFNASVAHLNASQLSETIIAGDSGQPIFTAIDGELVLLGSHWSATSCRNAASMITEINSAMTSLGGGYQLTIVDLSGFPNYV